MVTHNEMFDLFATLSWKDLKGVQETLSPFLSNLASNKAKLRELVDNARANPQLFRMCERHELLDYFVLYQCPKTDTRLRLHMHTDVHKQRPHNHRFPFCTLIVRGRYEHHWNRLNGPLDASTRLSDLQTAYITTERVGSCYTLSANVVHTTITTADTVSLFVRGPAELDRSIIIDRESGEIRWRVSRDKESVGRRKQVTMKSSDFDTLRRKLVRLNVI